MSAEHDWQAVGYWYRCRLCGQWQDEQHTPQLGASLTRNEGLTMPRKWRVEWTDMNGKNWITRRPLGQREAAEKVRRLMRKTRSSGKHAVAIRCFPYVYATDPSLT